MDELTTHIQEEILWYILFAYDMVLADESKDNVKLNLKNGKRLQNKLYKDGCMRNFNGVMKGDKNLMRMKTHEIPQRDSLQYLGSRINKDREIEDVEQRMRDGWFMVELKTFF